MSKENIINVLFSATPQVCIRVINEEDSKYVQNQKENYPFELSDALKVTIITTLRKFSFVIPCGYSWNGADIPRLLWRCIGTRTDNKFLVASLVHDYMLEFKIYVLAEILNHEVSVCEYRRLTSLIFRHIIKMHGTPCIKSNIMSWAVQTFQSLFNKKEWKSVNNI